VGWAKFWAILITNSSGHPECKCEKLLGGWATTVSLKKATRFKQSTSWRKIARSGRPNSKFEPGVDVMITIFCDFCQFLEKKLAFFSKTNVMIKFLQKVAAI
jgi:hypothetical protein